MTSDDDERVVLKIGAEGVAMTLFRRTSSAGTEEYFTELNHVALLDLDDSLGPGIRRGPAVATFEAGLALLDKTPEWVQLTPVELDPTLAPRILVAVVDRLQRLDLDEETFARAMTRWNRVATRALGRGSPEGAGPTHPRLDQRR